MAEFKDYLPGGKNAPAGGIDEEIGDAAQQQQARLRDPNTGQFIVDPASTPNVDWEERFKELEQHNSRQAQTLGEYRRTIDNFIASPTPATPEPQDPPSPITVDEFYEDPQSTIQRAVDNHPVVQDARDLKAQMERDAILRSAQKFQGKHPDYEKIDATPEFQNWIVGDTTRQDLYSRGSSYDFSAADALFSLYKAEKGMAQVQTQQDIQQAELVSSSGEMVQEPPRYSRAEYVHKLMRARQGDLECEDWVKANAANYRLALEAGNVRD